VLPDREEIQGPAPPVAAPLTPEQEAGKDLFVTNCGACHTLEAAGTSGTIGPNLDQIGPLDEQRVLDAIAKGGTGSGAMPANLVTGKDAQSVADFVANAGG
jgi:cytochrome c551